CSPPLVSASVGHPAPPSEIPARLHVSHPMAVSGSASAIIDAPIDEEFKVAADIEGSTEWQREIKVAECEKHDKEGHQVLVHTETDAKVRTLKSDLRFSY